MAGAVDAALYLLLPEITVCYRCHAHYRGFARNRQHQAFDLHLAEQYDVHKADGSPEASARSPATRPTSAGIDCT